MTVLNDRINEAADDEVSSILRLWSLGLRGGLACGRNDLPFIQHIIIIRISFEKNWNAFLFYCQMQTFTSDW